MYLTWTDNRPDAKIAEAFDQAVAMASEEWSPLPFEGLYPRSGFGYQELRPCHLGEPWSDVDSWVVSITTAYCFTSGNVCNVTVNQDCYLVVTGLLNLSPEPIIAELRIQAGGEDLPIMQLEEMYAMDVSRVFLTQPLIFKPKSKLTISALGLKTGLTRFGFIGYTIAKRAYLINVDATTG